LAEKLAAQRSALARCEALANHHRPIRRSALQ
jgi:hypothetical protein